MITIKDKLRQKEFKTEGQKVFLSVLVAAAYLKEQFSYVCGKEKISLQQYNILRILKGAYPQGYARCHISERMIEKSPDITRLIDRLLKQGLVRRDKGSDDKRQSITKITDKGIELIQRLDLEVENFEAQLVKKLGTGRCNDLIEINEQILNLK
jgi:DNA-binding MarR family transcriptional regulator